MAWKDNGSGKIKVGSGVKKGLQREKPGAIAFVKLKSKRYVYVLPLVRIVRRRVEDDYGRDAKPPRYVYEGRDHVCASRA